MKIVIAGNYGAKNLGDEMILEGLLASLKAINPNVEITVLSADPQQTEKHHSVKSVPKFPAGFRSLINYLRKNNPTKKAVQECDYFILGGGGLFGSLSLHANFIWAVQALMAYRLKKPVIMYGQSVAPIKWPIIRKIVRKIFQKSQFIAVRDEDSKSELTKLNVQKEIHIMPDLALRIPTQEKSSTPSQWGKSAIIALRQISTITLEFKQNIAEFINWLIEEQNYSVKFINFQEGKESDNALHEEIIEMIHDKTKVAHIQDMQKISDLLAHYNCADFVLGMRLHSIITAAKTSIPFIAINYATKASAFLKAVKFQEYLIEQNNLEGLKDLFKKNQKNKKQIKEKLTKYSKDAIQKHLQIEKLLGDFILRD